MTLSPCIREEQVGLYPASAIPHMRPASLNNNTMTFYWSVHTPIDSDHLPKNPKTQPSNAIDVTDIRNLEKNCRGITQKSTCLHSRHFKKKHHGYHFRGKNHAPGTFLPHRWNIPSFQLVWFEAPSSLTTCSSAMSTCSHLPHCLRVAPHSVNVDPSQLKGTPHCLLVDSPPPPTQLIQSTCRPSSSRSTRSSSLFACRLYPL